ncbi:MAG: CoB--CoM heterodisulfide reductase iron-sulfur subunit C [Candidatus Bathyarchaeota archaeon BA1]|nr:MAG: CoB--CoM heterodisulfide reductase iron-sulfur subunit C [Candidatus Bathyarchaeota archaeon BA1]
MAQLQKTIVRLDELDMGFAEAVAKAGGEKINLCIQCGTCTASCPSGRRTAFRTRQIIRRALLGFRDKVLSDKDLWLCTTCYTCLERCPRGVDPTDVILALRNMAVRAGYMLDRHKSVAGLIVRYGHAIPIDDGNRKLRLSLGLSEVPPTTHMFRDALIEVQGVIKKVGFDGLIGFEWK